MNLFLESPLNALNKTGLWAFKLQGALGSFHPNADPFCPLHCFRLDHINALHCNVHVPI